MRANGANGVSAETRTDRDAENLSGNSQETPNPYQASDVKRTDGCTRGRGGRPSNIW